MNAKQFLKSFVERGAGAHLQFVTKVAGLVNESADLNESQQFFVQMTVQSGPHPDCEARCMQIATYINTCH